MIIINNPFYLQLQRRFVRDVASPRELKAFYPSFKKWIESNFPHGVDWELVIKDDDRYQYNPTEIETDNVDDNHEEDAHYPLQEEIGDLAVGMGESSSNDNLQDFYHFH